MKISYIYFFFSYWIYDASVLLLAQIYKDTFVR